MEKIDDLSQLKVKGVVMGPLHTVQKDQLATLKFMDINPEVGTNEDFKSLVDKAQRKGEYIWVRLMLVSSYFPFISPSNKKCSYVQLNSNCIPLFLLQAFL